jgi:hypothetical protein
MPPRALATALICVVLAGVFALLSYSAALTKSATLDEPLHVAGAFADARLGDHRIDLENPPLWKYWMMLPIRRGALQWDLSGPDWTAATGAGEGQVWATRVLYLTPGNNGIALINAARAMMLLLGVATLVLTAAWAYRLAGPIAAITAAFLFTVDPTFLAHASIVKNDVALALLMLILVIALWGACQRITMGGVLGIALACAAAMNVKLSGLLLPVIAVLVLLGRGLYRDPWPWRSRVLSSRGQRVLAASAILVATALTCYIVTWATYGFRFGISPDPAVQIDLQPTLARIAQNHPDQPLSLPVRAALAIHRHYLLPEAWIVGFIRFLSVSDVHQNYLLGQVRDSGWWYYFPLALAFKMPLATLAAGAAAALFVIVPSCRRRLGVDTRQRFAIVCCTVAGVVYLAAAMGQNIDHGVRHMLPLYPLVFVVIGIVVPRVVTIWKRPTLAITTVLAIALIAESLTAWPNYIGFFNLAAGRSRGGLRLLGDSNLDWGQDLPLLAKWQREHPQEKLYLCYYGAADPAAYGIEYTNLAGGFFLGPPPQQITSPGVIAISATRFQGLYMSPELRASYARLRDQPVREVLGGSIYLFDYPPKR